jgi:hypothetical protein
MRFLVLLVFPVPAYAAWPEDVSVSGLVVHQGSAVEPEVAREALDQVIDRLGVGIANKAAYPARTLGSAGFDLSLSATVVLLNAGLGESTGPTPWERVHPNEDPAASLVIPALTARKGLPGSIEVGGTAGWLGGSRQGLFGGFLRFAPVEGYEPWPDLAIQVGYTGYVGNPELDLGALDFSGTIGGTAPFGSFPGIRQAQFSPWIGGGIVLVHARTHLEPEAESTLYAGSAEEDPTLTRFRPHPQIHGGMQITNSTLLVRVAGTYSLTAAPSLHAAMGFMF